MLTSRPRRRASLAVGAALVAAIASGCTGERPELAAQTETTTAEPAPGAVSTGRAEVAHATGDAIDVYADATSDTPAQHLVAADITSAPGIPLVFLVKSDDPDRVEVYLPTAPPGATAWLRRADITLRSVGYRIEVSLSEHRIRVREGADVVLDEPAGIGPDRPDPSEGLFIRELVQPPDQAGPYGIYAYGLAGAASVREGLEAGRGLVGIHGTDDPATVGTDMAQGSIAVDTTVLNRLVDELGLPLGTPVTVVP